MLYYLFVIFVVVISCDILFSCRTVHVLYRTPLEISLFRLSWVILSMYLLVSFCFMYAFIVLYLTNKINQSIKEMVAEHPHHGTLHAYARCNGHQEKSGIGTEDRQLL